ARRAGRAPRRDRGPAAGFGAPARWLRFRAALPARHGALSRGGTARDHRRGRPRHTLLAREPGGSALLEGEGLTKRSRVRRGLLGRATGLVRAVDAVSFTIDAGTTLGLVGESGCGKTTTSKLVLRLERPTAGAIRFEGADVLALDREGLRGY